MKIGDSLSSLYLLSANVRLGTDNPGQKSHANDEGRDRSFVPTVTPGRPPSLGLENDLWLSSGRQQELANASADLFEQFLEWSEMTPAERIRAEMLEERDLTEDALAAMPEEERAAIEEDIRRAIEQVLGIAETKASTLDTAGTADGAAGDTASGTE